MLYDNIIIAELNCFPSNFRLFILAECGTVYTRRMKMGKALE